MSNIAHLPAADNDSFNIDGPAAPLILPGRYDAAFDHHRTARMFGRAPKLILIFRIVSFGEAFNTTLPRYYNAKSINGQPKRSGGFTIGRQSAFLREYLRLFYKKGLRLDRLPMSEFRDRIFEIDVKTVTRGNNNQKIPLPLQYSVVSEILRVKQP